MLFALRTVIPVRVAFVPFMRHIPPSAAMKASPSDVAVTELLPSVVSREMRVVPEQLPFVSNDSR